MHAAAQRAGKFFSRGTGLPTVMRKNQPLVPRLNIASSWTRGGGGIFIISVSSSSNSDSDHFIWQSS